MEWGRCSSKVMAKRATTKYGQKQTEQRAAEEGERENSE